MKLGRLMIQMFLGVLIVVSVVAAEDWGKYESDEYGFSMLVPEGTVFAEKEASDGWGFLYAKSEDVEFYAMAKLGTQATADEIEKVGVKVSGIPDKYWKVIDKGEKKNGWNWWQTVEASDGHTLVFAGYGTGPKGSYLCFVKTTEADYNQYKADYRKWYDSITLY